MSLIDAAKQIISLYRVPNDSSLEEDELKVLWGSAIGKFRVELELENEPATLEICILSDPNWEISVEERLALIRKAKDAGVTSKVFLMDYYAFLSAHLDPCEEKTNARLMVEELLSQRK